MKAVHRTKPPTVLDVGQTLHAMSQTLCHHTAYENMGANESMGADDFPVQICEPTVGELLARQVRCTSTVGQCSSFEGSANLHKDLGTLHTVVKLALHPFLTAHNPIV